MTGGLSSSSTFEDEVSLLSNINVTPLVDVTLVLLIVFMITVPAIVGIAPVKVDLPDSSNIAPELELPLLEFTLIRNEDGGLELCLNDRPIDDASVRKLFSDSGSMAAGQGISLSVAKGILWEDVVKAIDRLKSLGVENLKVNTRHIDAR